MQVYHKRELSGCQRTRHAAEWAACQTPFEAGGHLCSCRVAWGFNNHHQESYPRSTRQVLYAQRSNRRRLWRDFCLPEFLANLCSLDRELPLIFAETLISQAGRRYNGVHTQAILEIHPHLLKALDEEHAGSTILLACTWRNTIIHSSIPEASALDVPGDSMCFCAVPHLSISQAGCACVCRSQAWDAKIVTSAWWVAHDQVTPTKSGIEAQSVAQCMSELALRNCLSDLYELLNPALSFVSTQTDLGLKPAKLHEHA